MMTREDSRSTDVWARYEPTADAPWDLRRVVHLHRRAGLGANWGEIRRDLAEGPKASIGRLLEGHARPFDPKKAAEFERMASVLVEAAVASSDPGRLKAWWFYRLLFSPDPLGERLTLMWHNHFATSILKVGDPTAMRRQNELLRTLAREPFGTLLEAMVRDPALLTWLDAPANRKGHPNENLARELMELFTLGIGHYNESDVKETARALTGWTVGDGEFREAPSRHDDGAKTILGKSGRFGGADVVRILLEAPSTADRLAWRLCDTFMGEGAVGKPERIALADGLRSHHLDIRWAVATILRSRAFFAASNIRTKVLSPVEFVVGPVRSLEMIESPPSTLVLADWSARLGQDLFNPPNVGGWPGGRSWLSARSLIGRTNFAAALVEGRGVGRGESFDPIALARHRGRGRDSTDVIRFCAELLLGVEPDARWIDRTIESLGLKAKAAWNEGAGRRIVAQILASPEAQVG
ncbi:MAG: DUF1800 domain-containing protein [Isosphaeraceae bacterium]